jgi:hypothetical protein
LPRLSTGTVPPVWHSADSGGRLFPWPEYASRVRFKEVLAKAIFCCATAVLAAALSDPVVEGLSNAGLFGPGAYTDHSTLDVAPTLAVGLGLSLLFIICAVRRALAPHRCAPGWLRAAASLIDQRSAQRLLPAIFALQMSVLWLMETLEQIVVVGHPFGGMIWLGGPLAASLVFHVVGCVLVTGLLARALRWSAHTIADVIISIHQFFCTRRPARSVWRRRTAVLTIPRLCEPLLARLSGRAPPYLSATS